MKLAFIKQPWCIAWSWQSTRYESAYQMLDSFYYKTTCFSLLAHWHGDVWMMEDSGCRSDDRALWENSDPETARQMWRRTPLTAWADVPWGDYDIVVSAGRIIPPDIINTHPQTLWVVLEKEHTAFRNKEPGAYDLFWDYTDVDELPYMVNLNIMRELIKSTNEAAVWLPSRSVRPHGMAQVETPPVKLVGLPVKCPRVWNLGRTYRAALDGGIEAPLDFWKRQGSCRYLLNLRDADIGQPIIEAAALGLIVLSCLSAYSMFCHPYCGVNDLGVALPVLERVVLSPTLRQVILDYQDEVLQMIFWRRPLAKLEEAIEQKVRT